MKQHGVQDSFSSRDEHNAATEQYPFVRCSLLPSSRVQLQKMATLAARRWQSPITAKIDMEMARSSLLHRRRCRCGCCADAQQQWCF